jgi:chromosome segregation ATPase
MSSQVISYRLSTEDVLQLRQKALPGESDNQTAQRLIRETLGVSTTLSTATFSLSTGSLDERIESILEERLLSLVSNQNDLLSRLQEVEARVKKLPASNAPDVDKLKTDVDKLQKERDPLDARNLELEAADDDLKNDLLMKDEKIAHLKEELEKLKAIAPQPTTNDQELLTQAELSKRLGCDSGTLTKNRSKPSFKKWSQSKDPEGKAWEYLPDTQRYGLSEAQKSSWEARVDEVVGSL